MAIWSGDQLLIAIAQRLQAHIRSVDLAARLGGDEFVLLLEDIEGADNVVQIVERILDDCQHPFVIQGHEVFTGNEHWHCGWATDITVWLPTSFKMPILPCTGPSKIDSLLTSSLVAPCVPPVVERHTLEMELHRAIELNELVVPLPAYFGSAD